VSITRPARRATAGAALLCSAVLAAGCASATQPQSVGAPTPAHSRGHTHRTSAPPPASDSPSAGTSTTPAAPAATSGCASSVLKAVVNVSQGDAAAGTAYYPVDFTNTSGSTCTMFGYPGVSFAAGDGGARIGRAASRNPAVTPATVTVGPGGVAHATIGVADAGNYSASQCKPVTVHWLKIYPPNQTAPIFAHFTVQACSALPHSLGSQLSVYATRHGPGTRGEGP
jgi:uncharacterized protein DUF4232